MSRPGSPTYGYRTKNQWICLALGLTIFVVCGGIAFLIVSVTPEPTDGSGGNPYGGAGALALLALAGFVVAVWALITPAVEGAISTAKVAFQPIPPPQFVQSELTAYFGRPPTPGEVDLVLRYFRDRKIAAQMDTALLGGAVLVASHFGATQH